jgi:hypothetical protein
LSSCQGGLALYTGVWPTGWSTGWPSLYLFEAVAVFAFGFAWIIAGLEPAVAIQERAAADMQRLHGPAHPDTVTATVNLASAYRSAGRADAAVAVENQIVRTALSFYQSVFGGDLSLAIYADIHSAESPEQLGNQVKNAPSRVASSPGASSAM